MFDFFFSVRNLDGREFLKEIQYVHPPRTQKNNTLAIYIIQSIIYPLAGDQKYSISEQNPLGINDYIRNPDLFFSVHFLFLFEQKKVIHVRECGNLYEPRVKDPRRPQRGRRILVNVINNKGPAPAGQGFIL